MAADTTTATELTAEQVSTMLVQPLEAASVVVAAGPRIFDTSRPLCIPKLTGSPEQQPMLRKRAPKAPWPKVTDTIRRVLMWGLAGDGAAVELSFPPTLTGAVLAGWPPIGLDRIVHPPSNVALRIEIGLGRDGETSVMLDGVPAHGGLDRVESDLATFAAERLPDVVAVHAALIAGSERAILVPGQSGTGKSTLCVAAAAAGLRVLGDEYALVRPATGLATGWPQAVKIRNGRGTDRVDLATPSAPIAIALVAIIRYDPAASLRLTGASVGEAAMGILSNTVCARSRPDESLDAALSIAKSAAAVTGTRGEADSAIEELTAFAGI